MTTKKKPIGDEFADFCQQWDEVDHEGKIALANVYQVTYDSAKHWRSEGGVPTRKRVGVELSFRVEKPVLNRPFKLETGSKLVTFAILGDTHHPYQDAKTMVQVERFLGTLQPQFLVYNGDINDFYQVSVFDKDPSRLGSLQSDLDMTTDMFERHSMLMPNTKQIFIEGTHEHRWFKYLRQNAPALANLNGTSIAELYKLRQFDITYVPFEQGVLVNSIFLFLHGDIISAYSSYTAKRHYEKHGGCGMCNHTHRGGSFYKRDRFGTWGWWENFCLCGLNPDWIQNPDWTQGFSLVHFIDDRFWVEQIPIIDSTFMYGGNVYGR